MEPCIFFYDIITDFKTNSASYNQGHFRHAKYENSRKIETYRNNHFKGSTNLGLVLPTEDAQSDDPRLASTC